MSASISFAVLRCVMGEDKVASFFPARGRESKFHLRLGAGLAVFEATKPPAARRGLLNVRGSPGDERLGTAKDFVVFLRRGVTVVQSGNDCAVRLRKRPFAVGLDR
jgi:hypothetical protein